MLGLYGGGSGSTTPIPTGNYPPYSATSGMMGMYGMYGMYGGVLGIGQDSASFYNVAIEPPYPVYGYKQNIPTPPAQPSF